MLSCAILCLLQVVTRCYKYFAPQAEHIEAAMATLPGLSEARHFCSHIQHSLTQWYDGSNWCAIEIWTWIHKFLFDSVCHSINLEGVAMQKCWWKWLKMVYPKLVFKVSLIGLIQSHAIMDKYDTFMPWPLGFRWVEWPLETPMCLSENFAAT